MDLSQGSPLSRFPDFGIRFSGDSRKWGKFVYNIMCWNEFTVSGLSHSFLFSGAKSFLRLIQGADDPEKRVGTFLIEAAGHP